MRLPQTDVNGIWRPLLFQPGAVLCASVCLMQMWARVDVNCTWLGDTGVVGEQRGGRLPMGETGTRQGEGLQGWSLDLSPLFFHFGPEVGPCLSGLVYEVGLESPFLHWHEGWT